MCWCFAALLAILLSGLFTYFVTMIILNLGIWVFHIFDILTVLNWFHYWLSKSPQFPLLLFQEPNSVVKFGWSFILVIMICIKSFFICFGYKLLYFTVNMTIVVLGLCFMYFLQTNWNLIALNWIELSFFFFLF